MQHSHSRTTSLRTQLGTILAALLILITLLALYAGMTLRSVFARFETVANNNIQEIETTLHLERHVTTAMLLADEYLVHHNTAARDQLRALSQEIDHLFLQALSKVDSEQDRALVRSAQSKWDEAQKQLATSEEILISQTLDDLIRLLDQIYAYEHSEIHSELINAGDALRRLRILVVAVFGAVVGLTVFSIFGLNRFVLAPLHVIKLASVRLQEGDLSCRLPRMTDDELGQLAQTFNSMAEQLERNQTALHEMAIHDALTGLFNRREFHRRLQAETERARRFGQPFALLLLDIDHFKVINDTYGHLVGDEVLREVARILSAGVRQVDVVTRFGGEEMTVLLPETNGTTAYDLAERIRVSIAEREFSVADGPSIRLTVSIGVAAFPEDASAPEGLVRAADEAAYAAKHLGRNRVSRYNGTGATKADQNDPL